MAGIACYRSHDTQTGRRGRVFFLSFCYYTKALGLTVTPKSGHVVYKMSTLLQHSGR